MELPNHPPEASPGGGIRVVDYDPRWRADFARLNIEWLERWFVVEPIDREVLSDPETHILVGGGRVLFAGRRVPRGAPGALRSRGRGVPGSGDDVPGRGLRPECGTGGVLP